MPIATIRNEKPNIYIKQEVNGITRYGIAQYGNDNYGGSIYIPTAFIKIKENIPNINIK